MNKFWGTFTISLLSLGLGLLLYIIPFVDPLKKSYEKFKSYYNGFIVICMIIMFVANSHIILFNLGYKINPNSWVTILMFILFYYAGIILEKVKRNWFIGVRTPWTLSSDY